jgi:serine/threonine-protein kinase
MSMDGQHLAGADGAHPLPVLAAGFAPPFAVIPLGAVVADTLEPGAVVGGYVLEGVLGRGGMGTVYFAKHERLGRLAAVKVLHSEMTGDAHLISRFFQEAKIVNAVRHPNIVDVIDFIQTPSRVAFIMEYLEGDGLDRYLRDRGRLSLAQAANVVSQIVDGLSAVHAIGVIHRDLKPANLRFTVKAIGDCMRVPIVKILDFGIAKSEGPMVAHKTSTGIVMGTPSYMAPEQVAGERVSVATDVYAVGEILYELITGQRLFHGTNTAVLRAKLSPEPPDFDVAAVGEDVRDIVRSCLAFAAADRPTIGELRLMLGDLLLHTSVLPAFGSLDEAKPTVAVAPPVSIAPVEASPMNTLSGDRSFYGASTRRSNRLPIALAIASVLAMALVLASRKDDPIVARPMEPPAVVRAAVPPVSPPAPPPVPPPPVSSPPPAPARAAKVARPPRSPSAPVVIGTGRVRVTAWTTAGRQIPAKVSIDGRAAARAAPIELDVKAGRHTVVVEGAGYPPKAEAVVVEAGETAVLDVVVDLK